MQLKSELIRSVLLEEFERNKRFISRYQKEADELQKGSIFKLFDILSKFFI